MKVSFLARDRERDREREFFFGLTFIHDHFGICQEYTWERYAHGHAPRTKLSLYNRFFFGKKKKI